MEALTVPRPRWCRAGRRGGGVARQCRFDVVGRFDAKRSAARLLRSVPLVGMEVAASLGRGDSDQLRRALQATPARSRCAQRLLEGVAGSEAAMLASVAHPACPPTGVRLAVDRCTPSGGAGPTESRRRGTGLSAAGAAAQLWVAVTARHVRGDTAVVSPRGAGSLRGRCRGPQKPAGRSQYSDPAGLSLSAGCDNMGDRPARRLAL